MKRTAFTLVELLVVIAIIGLLSTIAVVSMNTARDKAKIAAGLSFERSIFHKLGDRLEGEWKFESVGATTPDTSGMERTGTVLNGTLATGITGGAISLDGSGYVTVGTMSISNAITVGAWIKPTTSNQNGFIVGKNPVNEQWELFLESGFLRWRGGVPVNNSAFCPAPSANVWHYVVGTQLGNEARLYIDGILCGSGTMTAIANGAGLVQIGTFAGSYNFNGLIDEVRVYSGSIIEP
jgi:prepilin-type N-terminal cleavage/methylation domain-containing protein